MANTTNGSRPRGVQKLGDIVGKVLDPLTARRGHATTSLMAGWADIVGPRYAGWSRPIQIRWARGAGNENAPACLVVRADGPRAVYLQHEAGQIVERVNAFFGYAAIDQIRIVQGPVATETAKAVRQLPAPTAAEEQHLVEATAGVDSEGLREALQRLGRGVMADTGE